MLSCRFCAFTWNALGMRWCTLLRLAAMFPSRWRASTCSLFWPKTVLLKSPHMTCCQSFVTMALLEVWDSITSYRYKPLQACFHCILMHIYAYAGGHYIAYCQNVINGQWYEFDDQYVTEVHETVVQNAEAYVLFYRWVIKSHIKCNQRWLHLDLLTVHTGRAVRSQCGSGRKSWPWPIWRSPACCSFTSPENGWTSSTPLLNQAPSATTHFFVSMEVCSWETHQVNTRSLIQRLMGFLCTGIPPNKYQYIDDLVVIVPQNVWEYLYNR